MKTLEVSAARARAINWPGGAVQEIAGWSGAPAPHVSDGVDDISPELLQRTLDEICLSPAFAKARRSQELLRYLLEKSRAGDPRELSEYAIGIELYERDPRSYSTGEDPIVRVQVGRLRERLKQYYASRRNKAPFRLYIPLGSYIPLIEPSTGNHLPARAETSLALRLVPLRCINEDSSCRSFTQGLNEELSDQLFKQLGRSLRMYSHGATQNSPLEAEEYALEGSVRYEGETLKIAMRLVHSELAEVIWSHQIKQHRSQLTLDLQEVLAVELTQILRTYFV